jgi:HTH-type transcriptional regulator / antitoxin HigA
MERSRQMPKHARLDFRKPHVLRTPEEYEAAMAQIHDLLDQAVEPGTEDYERLEFLSVLAEAYEDAHTPEPRRASPQELVEFMLEQHGKTRADLAAVMGGKARVSQFLSGARRLSLAQVRGLRETLGLSADLLLPVTEERPRAKRA